MSLSFNYFLLISCSFVRFSSNYFIIIWSGWWERISTCWEIQKISLGRSAFWVKFWFLRGWMKPTTNHKFCNTHTHTHTHTHKRVYIIPNYLQILLKMLKQVHIDKVQAILKLDSNNYLCKHIDNHNFLNKNISLSQQCISKLWPNTSN